MDLAVWRDISLLWLIVLTLTAVLPIAVLFFYAIKGMLWLRPMAQKYLPLAQEKARLVAGRTEEISQKVAAPIIGVQAKAAQANGMTAAIFSRRKKA